MVVIEAPGFDDGAGLGEGGEGLFVQTLVAQTAVEVLDEPPVVDDLVEVQEADGDEAQRAITPNP
jgi:hypothetical protein